MPAIYKILKITDKYKEYPGGKYRKNRIFVLSKKLFNHIVNKNDRFSVKYIIDNEDVHIDYNKRQITSECILANDFIQSSVSYDKKPRIKKIYPKGYTRTK